MTAATVVRPLAPSEQIFAFGEVFVGYSARVAGRLDTAALTSAFETVVRSRPLLAAALEPGAGFGHTLVTSEPAAAAAPTVTVTDGDPEQLLTGAELDQRRAVCTLCVVRRGDIAAVTLLTHHSIADAIHSLAVFEELWSCYRRIVAGESPRLPAHPYPAPVEELLTARHVTKFPAPFPSSPQPLPPAPPSSADDPYPTLVTSRCLLTEAQTVALTELGRSAGVTIHGLVSAALLLTESAARQRPLTELMCSYSVDLRPRVSPPIGATEGTNVLGFTGYLPAADTEPTLVELARGVCAALRDGLASGFIQQTPLQLPDMAGAPPPNSNGTVMTTNWGHIAPLPTPEDLRVTDFRSTMIAKPDRTGRRPQQPGGGTTIVSTYGGRLSIEIHHPPEFTPVQLPRIARLTELLGGPSAVRAAGAR